jgi:two-component system nitrogen regulation response regulator GlnG
MPMNILIADSDKEFISDIRRSWNLDDTEIILCDDKDNLMPLVKNDPIDLAFI